VRVNILVTLGALFAIADGSRVVAEDNFLPPLYATLGCEGTDLNAIIVDCRGTPPYNEISCSFTRLSVSKQDAATSQKNREEFLAATARQTAAQRQAQIAHACETLAKGPGIDFSKQGPPAKLMRDRGLQLLKATCDCRGQNPACLTNAMLPILDGEERACTVSVKNYQDTFKRVSKGRWLSTEAIPVGCVAATTQVLEADPQSPALWTYSLTEIAAHPNPVPADPICAQFKGTNELCSWKHPVVGLLNCEEVHLR
jgi:hypothetical protein